MIGSFFSPNSNTDMSKTVNTKESNKKQKTMSRYAVYNNIKSDLISHKPFAKTKSSEELYELERK